MAFEKGREKTGGRKKGSKNKSTLNVEVKENIGELLLKTIADILNDWEQLSVMDKINLLPKLTPYILPKKSSNLKVNWSALDESEQAEVLEQLKSMLKDE